MYGIVGVISRSVSVPEDRYHDGGAEETEDKDGCEGKAMISEEWRTINSSNGMYDVSNLGRVRSHDYVQYRSNGKVMCNFHLKGRILQPFKTGKGYWTVFINDRQRKKVHRLVAEAFLENPNDLPEVNHIDGNKDNNAVNNLEWVTTKQNIEHAVRNRLNVHGEKSPFSKLTENQVKEIRNICIVGDKQYGIKPLARKYGVGSSTIKNIVSGKKWRYLL